MKRALFLCLLIASVLTCFAEKKNVDIRFQRVKEGVIGSGIDRSIVDITLPIVVTIDDSTGYLEVTAPSDLTGMVYVYSVSGSLERSASKLNVTLPIPQRRQTHVVSIKGDDWSGEGKFIY